VSGMSFGFRVLDDEWHLEEGDPVRVIFSMDFHEVSRVTFPAYEATDLNVGAASTGRSVDYWSRVHRTRMAR